VVKDENMRLMERLRERLRRRLREGKMVSATQPITTSVITAKKLPNAVLCLVLRDTTTSVARKEKRE
jgi:hypothetical protein